MFSEVKKKVALRFEELKKDGQLFYCNVDRDEVWEVYLSGFTPEERQANTCNCCRSFLRQYSGIVSISNNLKKTLWDFEVEDPEFKESIKKLREYILSLPVSNLFLSPEKKCGTDKNFDSKNNVNWTHYSLEIPDAYVNKRNLETVLAEKRETKNVFKRGLEELTIEATETVLELIGQNSIYRGNEFKSVLTEFLKLQKEYARVPADLKDNYAWKNHANYAARIRGNAIGVLLILISEGVELDEAVRKFETSVMAPSNYKRPTAIVTNSQIEKGKTLLAEAGYITALERRYANEGDVKLKDVIFSDKSKIALDVFDQLLNNNLVNPKTFKKVEEISINDFITNVVPTANTIEVLPERKHFPNFVSIIASKHEDAKNIFKWDNQFSWAYTGDVTDSIKEKVKKAGGKVDGDLRFSIVWNEDGHSIVDLDAHAYEPSGNHIYFSTFRKGRAGNDKTLTGGQLDVDMIDPSSAGVENITWPDKAKLQSGDYKFSIHNYNSRRHSGVKIQIEMDGEVVELEYNKHFSGTIDVGVVTYDAKSQKFTFKPSSLFSNVSTTIVSDEKWEVKSNQWRKVNKLMFSPNYWDNEKEVGNKHFFFLLEGCVSDESPRPFFNEYLKNDFAEIRKLIELLGSRLKVENTRYQLSGLGFSDTQRNEMFVRVTGNVQRILKIKF